MAVNGEYRMLNKLKICLIKVNEKLIKGMNKTSEFSVAFRLFLIITVYSSTYIILRLFLMVWRNLYIVVNENVIIHALFGIILISVINCIFWILLSFIKSSDIRKLGIYILLFFSCYFLIHIQFLPITLY